MSASFLENQLRRIRELTEQMSRVTSHAAELSDELARTREASPRGPLYEVRDLRPYDSMSWRPTNESKERSQSDAGTPRRQSARDSSRRRR